jgi:hypothetical protein
MTTPGGLPQKGDRLRYVGDGRQDSDVGREFIVVERRGTGTGYSVILRAADGKPATRPGSPWGAPTRPDGTRYPADHRRLIEAGYWIGRTYQYVQPARRVPTGPAGI